MRMPSLSVVLCVACAASRAAPPTVQSVKSLLQVTRAESLMDQAYENMEQTVKQRLSQPTAGRSLTDEQRRAMELAPARVVDVMKRN